jgi:hypothetical protein
MTRFVFFLNVWVIQGNLSFMSCIKRETWHSVKDGISMPCEAASLRHAVCRV